MKLWRRSENPLWEVVDRHFEEAEFLAERWRDAFDEPDITLHELAVGTEQRLAAHLDALELVGAPLLERTYWPALADASTEAALALVSGLGVLACGELEDSLPGPGGRAERGCRAAGPSLGDDKDSLPGPGGRAERGCRAAGPSLGDDKDGRRLLALLGEVEVRSERWHGLVEALALSRRAGLEQWLRSQLGDANEGPAVAAVVAALARRQVQLGPRLTALLASEDPNVLEAAATLARSGDPQQLQIVAGLGEHPNPRVVAAAVETALVRGVAGAVEAARYWAFDAPSCEFRPRALLWLGVLGQPGDQRRLIALLEDPERRRAALRALGFGGSVEAVEAALPLLADAELGALAGELMTAIVGLPREDESLWVDRVREDDAALPPLADDALDADLAIEPEELLPVPDPVAVTSWCQQRLPQLDRSARLLGGAVLDDAVLANALLHEPMRRRHALGLLAQIRSQGAQRPNTRDWAQAQLDAGGAN
ncbi:HEAT repeat domain-containing protein [Enhygromyxa salina]|uniref:HEAT repeat domain-containing protein n=1 Tax=Enhygromyxa salina TaxID=215803 RepID=UPI0011B23EF2|nr:hypothetical protein [Enhygromyxa salina]